MRPARLLFLTLAACMSSSAEPPPQRTAPVRASLPSLAPLVDSVKSAVVNVDTRASLQAPPAGDDVLEQFFRGQRAPTERRVHGLGSGFIVRADGKVLTNHHVVAGASDIRVKLEDGREFPARVLGSDPLTDLALLELKGEVDDLPVLTMGNSDAMRVGDWVVAIGNPFGLASSVSAGILSAKERDIRAGPYDEFLQTDAAINPGNSGGPLFNADGQVIGINTIMIGGSAGIGFAVPSNVAAALLPQLEKGEVKRGWLGVAIQDLTPAIAKGLNVPKEHGAVITEASPDTPADKAGLKSDDVMVTLDKAVIASPRAFSRSIAAKAPGAKVRLGIYRAGKPRELEVTLGQRPPTEEEKPMVGQREQAAPKQTVEELGMQVQAGNGGLWVVDVEPGSAADEGGLVAGMVITQVGGKLVRSVSDFEHIVKTAKPGSTLLLRIEADGTRLLRAIEVPRGKATG